MSPPDRPKGKYRTSQTEGIPVSRTLHVLCAGAVQGLVRAMKADFQEQSGAVVEARFGAVGAMKEALMSGAPCDVLIVTDAMLRALVANGAIDAEPLTAIGRVRTGLAVRAGDAMPRVDTAAALKATLLAAPALYVPDTVKSTAGAHVASVLDRLGLRDALAARLAVFANGATAMAALAESGAEGALGCTQISEILYTPGLALADILREPFGLATMYSAGVSKTSNDASLAARFIALLCGPGSAALRQQGGFD